MACVIFATTTQAQVKACGYNVTGNFEIPKHEFNLKFYTMSNAISKNISGIIEPVISDLGMELVDVEFKKEHGQWVLCVFIDREGGVRLQDCGQVSREIEPILEAQDPVNHPYTLEVSSPGLQRVLNKAKDYERFQGKRARIKLFSPLDGKKTFSAKIQGMEGEKAILDRGGKIYRIPLSQIARANLEIEW